MADVGKVNVKYTGDTTDFVNASKKVQNEFKTMAGSAKSSAKQTTSSLKTIDDSVKTVGDNVQKLKSRFVQFASALGIYAFVPKLFQSAKSAVIDFNQELDQARISFTTFTGSAKLADDELKKLQRFAASTPFQFKDLLATSQQMMAMGATVDQLIPRLTAIGDAAAALGGSAETMERITRALGQIQAKGRVQGEELLQLAEAGIPAYKYLAQAMGTDIPAAMKKIKTGTVDSGMAINAILKGITQDFGGMMEQQSRTMMGAFSNVQDFVTQIAANVTRPLFEKLKTGMVALSDFLGSKKTQEWATETAQKAQDFFDTVIKGVKELQQRLGPAFSDLREAFQHLPGMAKQLWINLKPILGGALLGVVAAVNAMAKAFRLLVEWIERNRAVMMLLVTLLVIRLGRDAVKGILDLAKAFFEKLSPAIADAEGNITKMGQGMSNASIAGNALAIAIALVIANTAALNAEYEKGKAKAKAYFDTLTKPLEVGGGAGVRDQLQSLTEQRDILNDQMDKTLADANKWISKAQSAGGEFKRFVTWGHDHTSQMARQTQAAMAQLTSEIDGFNDKISNINSLIIQVRQTFGITKEDVLDLMDAFSLGAEATDRQKKNFIGVVGAMREAGTDIGNTKSVMDAMNLSIENMGDQSLPKFQEAMVQVANWAKYTGKSFGEFLSAARDAGVDLGNAQALRAFAESLKTVHGDVLDLTHDIPGLNMTLGELIEKFTAAKDTTKEFKDALDKIFDSPALKAENAQKAFDDALKTVREHAPGAAQAMKPLVDQFREATDKASLFNQMVDQLFSKSASTNAAAGIYAALDDMTNAFKQSTDDFNQAAKNLSSASTELIQTKDDFTGKIYEYARVSVSPAAQSVADAAKQAQAPRGYSMDILTAEGRSNRALVQSAVDAAKSYITTQNQLLSTGKISAKEFSKDVQQAYDDVVARVSQTFHMSNQQAQDLVKSMGFVPSEIQKIAEAEKTAMTTVDPKQYAEDMQNVATAYENLLIAWNDLYQSGQITYDDFKKRVDAASSDIGKTFETTYGLPKKKIDELMQKYGVNPPIIKLILTAENQAAIDAVKAVETEVANAVNITSTLRSQLQGLEDYMPPGYTPGITYYPNYQNMNPNVAQTSTVNNTNISVTQPGATADQIARTVYWAQRS